jgi:hypothetical protein
MSRLRILVLAPDANPDSVTGPLIAYSQAQALARLHEVTLAIRTSCEDAVRRRQGAVHSVEVIRLAWLEYIHAWIIHRLFRNNYYNQLLQAFNYPFSVIIEWQTWRQMRGRIRAGEFDLVLRLLPITTIRPSPFAYFLRNGPVPLVIGPVNGGLPWASGFRASQGSERLDLWLKETVPVSTIWPVHLSPRGSDRSWFLPHLCGIIRSSRKALLSAREWR